MAETAKKSAPALVVTEIGQNGSDNVVLNHKRPPFDNLAVRRAVSLALDRHALRPGRTPGRRRRGRGAHAAKPLGVLGAARQGARDAAGLSRRGAGQGRRPSACSPRRATGRASRCSVELVTRTFADLHRSGVVRGRPAPPGRHRGHREADGHGARGFPTLARRDFQIGANLTARRRRRSRRVLLRELQVRLAAQLHGLLQRGGRPAHRRAVAGAGPRRSDCGSSGTSSASSRPTWPARCSAGARNTSPSGPT